MSDVFISYSRLDKEFVGKLRNALAEHRQEIWIDWESIPPSQAWWSEIQKGIARANNFVVVLSPNSMASPICQMEIEYAYQLGKRIIPVLYKDYIREDAIKTIAMRLAISGEDTTRALWGNRQPHSLFDSNESNFKRINYFLFRPEDDFLTRFEILFEVIRTDYAYKEQHTTLELRAQEWHRRRKNVSFLLLDDELVGAKEWLAQAIGKEPTPTQLQRGYIKASESRTRQLRNLRRSSVLFAVAAVVAFILALSSSTVGIRLQQQIEEGNATLSSLNNLVAAVQVEGTNTAFELSENRAVFMARQSSQQLLIGDWHDALLLALESLRDYPTMLRDESTLALIDVLNYPIREIINFDHDSPIVWAEWNNNETLIATLSMLGRVEVWDTLNSESIHFAIDNIDGVIWNNQGDQLLTWSNNSEVQIWEAASGELLRTFNFMSHEYESDVRGVVWNMTGSQILVRTIREVTLWNTSSGDLLFEWSVPNSDPATATGPSGTTKSVYWDPHETQIAINYDQTSCVPYRDCGVIAVVDTSTGTEKFTLHHSDPINGVSWNANGTQLLTWSVDGNVKIWDAMSGTLKYTITPPSPAFHHCQRNPSPGLGRRCRGSNEIIYAQWNNDGNLIVTLTTNRLLSLWGDFTQDFTSNFDLLDSLDGVIDFEHWDASFANDVIDISFVVWFENSFGTIAYNPPIIESKNSFVHLNTVEVTTASSTGYILSRAPQEILLAYGEVSFPIRINASFFGATWNKAGNRFLTWSNDGIARIWEIKRKTSSIFPVNIENMLALGQSLTLRKFTETERSRFISRN